LVQAEKDGLKEELAKAYSNLQQSIDDSKSQEIDDKKNEIKNALVDEIVKRYFYREGLYEYHILNNDEIAEAIAVLQDSNRYTDILN